MMRKLEKLSLAFLIGYVCVWSTNFVAFHHIINEYFSHDGTSNDDQYDNNETSLSRSVDGKNIGIAREERNGMGAGKTLPTFPVLTAYLEPNPPDPWHSVQPLPLRNIVPEDLTKIAFGDANRNQYESYLKNPIQSFLVEK